MTKKEWILVLTRLWVPRTQIKLGSRNRDKVILEGSY